MIISCKKEESITLKDKLTKYTWKSTGLVSDGVNKDKWCWLNSLYNFTYDGKVFITKGDNLGACVIGDPIGTVSKKGYSISADEKWIIFKNGAFPSSEADSFQVVSISETTLKTKRVLNKGTDTPNTWEDTFTAQ